MTKRIRNRVPKTTRKATTLRRYLEDAEVLLSMRTEHKMSERELAREYGLAKSSVHRMLTVAYLPNELKKACLEFNTEKYVLVEYAELIESEHKRVLYSRILNGTITKRKQLWEHLSQIMYETAQQVAKKKYYFLPSLPKFLEDGMAV